MGGCCAAEDTAASNRHIPVDAGIEKKSSEKKSGQQMGVMPKAQAPVDNKTKYADRPKIILGYWNIRGLA